MHKQTSVTALIPVFATICVLQGMSSAVAQTLPSAADIDRVNPQQNVPPLKPAFPPFLPEQGNEKVFTQPPEGANQIKITLQSIKIQGSTVYTSKELEKLYKENLKREITLDKLWVIADAITKKYRDDGYFLSRAFVPAQEIETGDITIGVVEGYIGDISIDKHIATHMAVKKIINALKKEKPITIKTLEREHLLLSDLPGMSNYQGVLAPLKNGPEGAVQLIFSPRKESDKQGYVGIDNFGSRYLGPYELSASWKGQIIPLQKTSIAATTSLPTSELSAINVSHTLPITEKISLSLDAGYTRSDPGYTIKPRDIESKAINAGISGTYQIIRQRLENLSVKLGFDGRNSESTIIGSELSNDKIRAVRLSANYDRKDMWFGYNTFNMTLSRGLGILGASEAGELNLSRDGAHPDFTKLEVEYSRLQGITQDWSALMNLSAQKASGSLFSSEEFGFGGQSLGRAYDPSEISGDDGVAGGLELRYQGLPEWEDTQFQPYAFYDLGKVWNLNDGQAETTTASSAGLGVRFQHSSGFVGTLQLALPLNKPADAPLYGSNSKNAQIGFQLGYSF